MRQGDRTPHRRLCTKAATDTWPLLRHVLQPCIYSLPAISGSFDDGRGGAADLDPDTAPSEQGRAPFVPTGSGRNPTASIVPCQQVRVAATGTLNAQVSGYG